jgi:hypothetical protein
MTCELTTFLWLFTATVHATVRDLFMLLFMLRDESILLSVTCSCYCLSYSSCHVRVLLLSVTIPVGELIGEQQCNTCLAMFGEQHLLAMFGEQHRDLFSE